MAVHKIGLLTVYGINKHKKKLHARIRSLEVLCDKGIFSNTTPLQSCGCQIKEILLYKDLEFVQPLGNTWWIWIFSYMEIRIYFHLLCNYLQTNLSCTDPPTF
jgi:hypothetical protein